MNQASESPAGMCRRFLYRIAWITIKISFNKNERIYKIYELGDHWKLQNNPFHKHVVIHELVDILQ